MDDLWKEIEKSTKTIFRIFFGSKLFSENGNCNPAKTAFGVDLVMNYQGKKKLSLYLEEDTIYSILNKIGQGGCSNFNKLAYEVIGELASIIACGALADIPDSVSVSEPERAAPFYNRGGIGFMSDLGNFSICISEI